MSLCLVLYIPVYVSVSVSVYQMSQCHCLYLLTLKMNLCKLSRLVTKLKLTLCWPIKLQACYASLLFMLHKNIWCYVWGGVGTTGGGVWWSGGAYTYNQVHIPSLEIVLHLLLGPGYYWCDCLYWWIELSGDPGTDIIVWCGPGADRTVWYGPVLMARCW